jgi:2-polyprenyl-3-methyl-5-hydroxy-6-metoxy-1,4-benzoquinol methylase
MNKKKEHFLTCLDHTVSNKKFDLLYDQDLDMLITFPQPKIEDLPSYYKSSAYISHTDSNKSFIDKLYQLVKKYTLNKKVKLINSFKTEQKNLLDVGCGTGEFLKVCKKNGWRVTGVEPNSKAKCFTESKLGNNSKSIIYSELSEIHSVKFDVITLWHVLEHVPNLENYISTLKNLLKPNGVVVVAVPNFKSYDANYYKEFWAAYDVPRHLWHFSKKSIQILFSNVKMNVVKKRPMIFDSFYVSLLSEKHKKGSTNFLISFCIGLFSNIKALSTKEYSSQIYIIKNT